MFTMCLLVVSVVLMYVCDCMRLCHYYVLHLFLGASDVIPNVENTCIWFKNVRSAQVTAYDDRA